VNSILPTAIEGAGVYGDGVKREFRDFIESFRPMQRMGTPDDVANVAEYLAGDLAGFVSGQRLLVTAEHPPNLRARAALKKPSRHDDAANSRSSGSPKIALNAVEPNALSILLLVSVGDLADKLGPSHVHGLVNLAGFRSRIILENFHYQGRVVRDDDASL
jgi:hypothetical protein